MTNDSANMQQAISKAVRSSLESLQRQSEELHQAIGDLVAACSSSRPANALPATLRAQSAAAALAASLDVLARFIAASPQSSRQDREQDENVRVVSTPIQEAPQTPSRPAPPFPTPMAAPPIEPVQAEPVQAHSEQIESGASEEVLTSPEEHVESPVEKTFDQSSEQPAPATFDSNPQEGFEPEPAQPVMAGQDLNSDPGESPAVIDYAPPSPETAHSEPAAAESAVVFDLQSLSQEEQEMHRRANRVAKVSMQDIQLLKPDQVLLGREHRDLCIRLNEEIGKARKEYERRFGPILGHGVDYFYHWMVEVLGAGDPEALGEYPYSTQPVRR